MKRWLMSGIMLVLLVTGCANEQTLQDYVIKHDVRHLDKITLQHGTTGEKVVLTVDQRKALWQKIKETQIQDGNNMDAKGWRYRMTLYDGDKIVEVGDTLTITTPDLYDEITMYFEGEHK